MSQPVAGMQVFCPLCKQYVQLLRIQHAAGIAAVHRRSIYRYIEEGSVFAVKIAGKTYRVCANCLLGRDLLDAGWTVPKPGISRIS